MVKTHNQLTHLEAVGLIKLVQTHPELEYLFRHALVQEVAYNSLLIEDRKKLHRKTGEVIEETYPNRLDEMAATLAHHFALAADVEKAIHYLHRAGEHATEISANDEAIKHFTEALKLLETLPDTPERTRRELALQIALGNTLISTKGYAASEVEQAYARARELCQQVGETPQLFPVLWGLVSFYTVRAQHQMARELEEQLLRLAQRQQDPRRLLEVHRLLGSTLMMLGEFILAQEQFAQGIALYDSQQQDFDALLYSTEPGIVCLSQSALVLWFLGYPDQAMTSSHRALTLAHELGHPHSLTYALISSALFHQFRRDKQVVQEQAEAALKLSTEQGFEYWLASGMILRGWGRLTQDHGGEGLTEILQGLTKYRTTGSEAGYALNLCMLAETYGKMGQIEEGLAVLNEGLEVVGKTDERPWETELYRLKGELLQMQGTNEEEVEWHYHKALDAARQQSARSLELRATVSLCRFWQQQGKKEEARQMLAEIYDWFTEGFDTVDLEEAKALLEELAE